MQFRTETSVSNDKRGSINILSLWLIDFYFTFPPAL